MKVSTLSPDQQLQPTDQFVISDEGGTKLATIQQLMDALGGGAGADIRSGSNFSSYATTEDSTSSSGRVYSSATTVSGSLATLSFDKIPFGLYSLIIRAKCEGISSGGLFTVAATAGATPLLTYTVNSTDFHTASKWLSLGIGIDFQGTTGDTLTVTITPITPVPVAYAIDYVQLSPAPVAVNSII